MEAADFQQTQSGRTSRKTEKLQKPEPSQADSGQYCINHHFTSNYLHLVSLPASNDDYKNRDCSCHSGHGHVPFCL